MHSQFSPLRYAEGNLVTVEGTKARWKPQTLLALILLLVNSTFAQNEIVLHTFSNFTTGEAPVGVIFDRDGNIFGATSWGGIQNCSPELGCGTIFELIKTSKGWRHKLLYSFQGGLDGANPEGDLVFDQAGNLYGTTIWGGVAGAGTVFELSPSKHGWTESIIHSFGEGTDGGNPSSGLTFGVHGSMYGSALWGGTHGSGAIYKLAHSKTKWDESIIYSFGADNQDGANPYGRPIFDSHGDLYGTTVWGGGAGVGTVYKLSRSGNGWVATVLHSFVGGDDGSWPEAGLAFDAAGNLFGTTVYGGGSSSCQFGCGTVFQLTPTPGGEWTTSVIHAFGGRDGANPYDSLVTDDVGNLYGTTIEGGASAYGTAFKLMPSSGGNWQESVLHNFTGGRDGGNPEDSVVLNAKGNIYGCAAHGGNSHGATGMGVVFEIVP